MKIRKYSEVRNNLRRELDLVVDDCEPTCVVSKNNQVVMMSKEQYDDIIKKIKGLY